MGTIQNGAIDEASGMQAGLRNPDAFFVHNDDGVARLFVMDSRGRDLGSVRLDSAANRDWEDITAVPTESGPMLVIADIGDNAARREAIALYFVAEPEPGEDGRYRGRMRPEHRLMLRYPDGPRDCEAVAFDPVARRLLLLTKRDLPPRIYGIDLRRAMQADNAILDFLGESHRLGPASTRRAVRPTGLDISRNGHRGAVITHGSLYVFERAPGEDWVSALGRRPMELRGPSTGKEEAVSFQASDRFLFVTAEGRAAPIYRFELKTAEP